MRLDRFDVSTYGTLRGFAAEDLAGHDVVVLLGGNESGKSTFRSFLDSILYGFRPSRLSDHPYAPVDGSAMEGTAGFALDNGGRATVLRRLDKVANGRLEENGGAEDLGNHPVPWVGTLPRGLFAASHALTLDEVAGLSDEAWSAIEERVLAGDVRPFLHPAGEVVARLGRQIERDDEVESRLEQELHRLQGRREVAADRLARLLDLRDEIEAHDVSIADLRERLATASGRLARAEVLLPVLRRLEEVERLRTQAHAWVEQDDFPEDCRERFGRMAQEVERLDAEGNRLRGEIENQERRAEITADEQVILDHEDEVRALADQSAVHQQDLVHVNDLDRQRTAQRAALDEGGNHLLDGPLDEPAKGKLARLSMGELRARVKAYEEARRAPEVAEDDRHRAQDAVNRCKEDLEELPSKEEILTMKQRERALRSVQSHEQVLDALRKERARQEQQNVAAAHGADPAAMRRKKGYGLIGVGGLLVVLMIAGVVSDFVVVGLGAAAAIGVGVMMVKAKEDATTPVEQSRIAELEKDVKRLRESLDLGADDDIAPPLEEIQVKLALTRGRNTIEARLVAANKSLGEANEAVEQAVGVRESARSEVADMFTGIPLASDCLENPGSDLLSEIESLRAAISDASKLEVERTAIVKRCDERQVAARELAEQLGERPRGKPMDAVPLWFERLQNAVDSRRRAADANKQLELLRAEKADVEQGQQTTGLTFTELRNRLVTLDPDGRDPGEGLNRLEQARSYLADADRLERALHADVPEWAERRDQAVALLADGEELDLSAEERVEYTARIADLERALAQEIELRDRLAVERDELAGKPELHDIEGALGATRARIDEVRRDRDRRRLTCAVLEQAEQRDRARNRHDLITIASEHVARFTGGRYGRLDVIEVDGQPQLFVHAEDRPEPLRVAEPLSRGVRDQIHLSLRLALASQVDGNEKVPLLLDDVFVNLDEDRRRRAAAELFEIGTARQVVVTTSDPRFAELLVEEAAAHVIELPAVRLPDAAPVAGKTHHEEEETSTPVIAGPDRPTV